MPKNNVMEAAADVAKVLMEELDGYGELRTNVCAYEVWIADANRGINCNKVAVAALTAFYPPEDLAETLAQKMSESLAPYVAGKVTSVSEEVTEACNVQTLVESLASFVSKEDIGMSRMDFLRTVASRILDDIDPG